MKDQIWNDLDTLAKYKNSKTPQDVVDRVLSYVDKGYISEADADAIGKFGSKVDQKVIDRLDSTINLNVPTQQKVTSQTIQESPKTVGGQLLDFGKKVATAVSPRVMTNPPKNGSASEFGRGLLSTGLDIASLAPRTIVSTMATPLDLFKDSYEKGIVPAVLNQPSRFIENLGVIETPKGAGLAGLVEDVARSPYLPIPGVGSAIPKTAGIIPKIAAGLGDITIGAGMGTAESVARTGEVNPLGAGLGGVLGSLNPLGRVVKAGADKLSDNAFTAKFVKTMQDQALNGNADAQIFLNNFAQNPNSQTVRDRIASELAGNDLIYGASSSGMKAYNEARKVAEASGKTADEANLIGLQAREDAETAFRNNYNTPVPQLSPDKTIKQAVSEYTGFEAPNIPRPLTYSPAVRSSVQGASEITGMPNVGAWLSLLTGAGSPYFAYDALRKNPHWASDATRYIPKQTGTVTRNLGATLLDGSGSENRR